MEDIKQRQRNRWLYHAEWDRDSQYVNHDLKERREKIKKLEHVEQNSFIVAWQLDEDH